MYERFTDRARKVMQLANQECQRFNHEYIGTEHLLIALVKEGSGVAATVLKNMDVDIGKLRKEVEKCVQPGPDMVTMGKMPLTPRTKKVIEFAIEEANLLQHNYLGTEHLLLGLLRESEGIAVQALKALGVNFEKVREEILSLLDHDKPAKDADAELIRKVAKECWSMMSPVIQQQSSRQKIAKLQDALEYAWVIICNAGNGDWTKESADWQTAAAKFREECVPLFLPKQPEVSRWEFHVNVPIDKADEPTITQ